jgi:hypothetical protein
VLALILGVIYLQQELSQNGIMNINGALFVLLTNLSFRKGNFSHSKDDFLKQH